MAENTQAALPSDHLLQETHVTFRYLVEIEKVPVGAFTECTLPTIEVQVKEVREGGLNSHAHQLPAGVKLTRLILKNGIGKNGMMDWWKEIVDEKFSRKNITVTLRDARFEKPICTWNIHDAYPVKWTGPQLQSSASAIAIQTIEFACGKVDMVVGPPVID